MSNMRTPFSPLVSRTFVLEQENIDTDQIIPARFLTTTTRTGLGKLAFHDWRYDGAGQEKPGHALRGYQPSRHEILVTGQNFGCGSSREHAPWALHDLGVRVVISSEIADIFRSNSAKNGILPIIAPSTAHRWLLEHPDAEVVVDLEDCWVRCAQGPSFGFEIEAFARRCLLDGNDPLGFLLEQDDKIRAYEEACS